MDIFYKLYRIWLRVLGYFSPCPFGKELQSYWDVRKELFSKFNQGIKIDAEGLYSVAPEQVLLKIAKDYRGKVVVDAFCGAGASSIAFAKFATKVYAIDLNVQRMEYAKHNASIYGVDGQIEFICGDAFTVTPTLNVDVVFLDPPWGGPNYIHKPKFTFNDFTVKVEGLILESLEKGLEVVLTIPKNFDLTELKKIPAKCEIQDQYFLGRLCLKTVKFTNVKTKNT